ncbi:MULTISPECIES: HIT family protein [unclassified Planococcus (in: firmicutes)]|uniref:HIT family protein n=1 Tax=unclassified Planococcus (in: firmicutes) TaxID=2662419 RepID=UPI000C3396AA|nr:MULTISPECIES: diadenosine tetraphosphate hydrolase [unclassified Planococcus (in: firmicutes)]AUD14344.1 diadenosine tetraphosphate hydrolase [Planococcus sp. MB-3u-03]PKG46641.1 diadenosine tetraphosphate hydrolase [Planococcus sp. Urea-trap-24]PKG89506.1 diadenosine tetraphosphate hydrolase [Planococcus sp. Urea-3u-39]PKH42060.1 diadenosine tetraphosphate hydrolase [Planococcus sp. MB-3u-09]
MRTITLANGETVEVECLSCALVNGLIEPEGGVVVETEHFHAHQDVAYPIPGLIILASKRHLKSLDEMTEAERLDYITILSEIRKAQRDVLGIESVYYFYNEDTTHHFHTWMVPRYEWMYEFGRSVESVRPVLLHARNEMNDEANLKSVRQAISALTEELKR